MPFREYIKVSTDLITPYAQTRAGFLKIALEKNQQASPFVAEAKALKTIALRAKNAKALLSMPLIASALLTASGLSTKALTHLTEDDKQEAINNLVIQFLEPAGVEFVDELVFRFLLTRGDSLGGKMRNLAGKIAEKTLLRTIVATLSIQNQPFQWYDAYSKKWMIGNKNDPHIETRSKGLSWHSNNQDRTLLLNLTVPLVGKNVDLCLLNASPKEIVRRGKQPSRHRDPSYYIALGELKGGIDPAGADEHWKTANSALNRIRNSFWQESLKPNIFFIGAAIENAMSEEIFAQLQAGELANAANLTDEAQLFALADWLCRL